MRNQEIREAAKKNGVALWKIAEKLGVCEATITRKLRYELSAEEREKILGIIAKIAAEQK